MKIISTQENLSKGLNVVSHITQKNISLPILNNVLIKTENGIIKFITTNLEIGIICQVRGRVDEQGSFTVNAKTLTEYISYLPKEKVEMKTDKQQIQIYTEKSQTKINGLPEDDFPLIPVIERKEKIVVDSKELKKAIQNTSFAASTDSTRIEISGILFKIDSDSFYLVATDSYRLAERKIKLKEKKCNEREVIIPIKTLQEVARILPDEDSDVEIYFTENQILFLTQNIEIVSRLVDGRYPDYKQIIPQNHKTKVVINRNEFIKSVKSASLFCQPGINDIHLSFLPQKKEVVIKTVNNQLGENISRIDAEVLGDENQIVFNYRYLLDGLNNIESDDAVLEIIDEANPGVLKNKDKDGYLYLIMPIKQ